MPFKMLKTSSEAQVGAHTQCGSQKGHSHSLKAIVLCQSQFTATLLPNLSPCLDFYLIWVLSYLEVYCCDKNT